MPINRWLFKYYACHFSPDVCHYTYFDTPEVSIGCKVVVTIHDMICELFPDMFSHDDPQHEWKNNAVARADGVICISENTKIDLTRFMDIREKRIAVIYHGNSFASIVPKKVDFTYPYLLYVGTRKSEYKNFELILRALTQCIDQITMHLVCFGGGVFDSTELNRIEEIGLSGRVHQFSGSDKVLAGYYVGAKALIYPSKYEGFGLPPIEAMGLGCLVLASNAAPMPEMIGDAGLYFDPNDDKSLSECIRSLWDMGNPRRLVSKGYKRATLFDWDLAANNTIAFYKTLL